MKDVQLESKSVDEIFEPEQSNVIETSLEEFDNNVERATKFMRLLDNQDFIDIISEGYIDADAERIGGLLTTTNRQVTERQDILFEKLKAKRYLRAYIEYNYNDLSQYLVPGQREELVNQLEAMESENE